MSVFSQLSKTSGPSLVDFFLDLLSSLLCRGNEIELGNRQKQKEHQNASDLFMDEESLITEESSDDKVQNPLIYGPEAYLIVNFDLIYSSISFTELFIKANHLRFE